MLLSLAADIVSAHVSNNRVSVGELPVLIEAVYGSLTQLGAPAEVPVVKPEPAVPVRTSVKPDAIACLECGAKMKMLKRHLQTEHGLSVDEYRKRWDLKADYPVVAPEYAAKRKELAKKAGLGRKPGTKLVPKQADAGTTTAEKAPSKRKAKAPAERG